VKTLSDIECELIVLRLLLEEIRRRVDRLEAQCKSHVSDQRWFGDGASSAGFDTDG
jgi:hypothetical protein